MTLVSWIERWKWLWGRVAAKHARRTKRHVPVFYRRLVLEELESRQVMSTAVLFDPTAAIALTAGASQTGVIVGTPTFYAVNIKDSGRLTADLGPLLGAANPLSGTTRLTLLSPDRQVLVQSDGQSVTNPNDLIDIHVTGSSAGTIYYLEVQGLGGAAGTYDLQTTFVAATAPFQPLSVGTQSLGHTYDLTGDGIPDLVVANFNTLNVSVLLGLGDGTFAPQTSYALSIDPNDVIAVDLKGKGILDLVTANVDGSLTILPGNGDGTFGSPIQVALGRDASSLVAGDFNGDGHMDLAVTDADTSSVAILLNNGDGTFAAPIDYKVGSGPTSIIAGDFNHNGRIDLATANENSNSVSVLLGNGDGTFQSAQSFAAGQSPRSVVAGGFSGDGLLSLATANAGSNDVSVLLNNGDGTFAAATSLAAGTGTTGIVAGDFTGNGHVDLAATNEKDGTLSIFTGRGDGTFAPQTTVTVGSAPTYLVAADFNHDGHLDLAHGEPTGHVFIDLGRGDGTFQTLPPVSTAAGPDAVVTGHFTNSGYLDMATLDQSTGDVQILLGRDDGTFQFGGRYAVGADPVSVATGDFNHDGILDLVVTNYTANTVAVLMGHGDGTFGAPTFFATGGNPYDVVTGDFNRDGNLDLAVADSGSDSVSILLGNGDGTFSAHSAHLDFAVGIAPLALVAGDLNGDGILDLATANVVGNDVSVLYGRGDGTFGNEIQLPAGYAPFAIVAGDFTGKGVLDLATANIGDGTVSVFLGNGDGTFAAQATYLAGVAPSDLVAASLTGSGHLDLAVTDVATNSLTVLVGLGDGTFQESAPVAVGIGPEGIAAGDFNGDGFADLATANFNSSNVSVLLNHGDGTFPMVTQVSAADGPAAVASADFMGDGYLDLVTANPTLGTISVSPGNGDGTFQAPTTISLGGEPSAIVTGDFNHDGRPDIAVTDYLNNTVSILLGLGDGTFEAPMSYAVGSHPDALATGDFNGDGILDLAVANFGSGTVSIFMGRADGSLAPAQQIAVGAGPVALAVGHVNGDGTTELIVANSLSRSLSILEDSGDRTFRLADTVTLRFAPTAVMTGDFTGAGKVNIAVTDQADNAVSVLLGNGDGTFGTPVSYAVGMAPVSLIAGDFNGDGHLDLATANNNSNNVTVLLGRGDGTFLAQAPYATGFYPSALMAGDFNGDGRLDIATANGQGQPVSVGIGLGDGTFTQPNLVASPIRLTPLVADFNGDGRLDVISLRQDGAILVRYADPSMPGAFEPPVVINSAPGEKAREIGLLTVFGQTYVVALSAGGNIFLVFQYVPGHNLALLNTVAIPDGLANHMAIGDLNGDGYESVVLTQAATGEILVEGPLEFLAGLPPHRFDVGPGPSSIALVDTTGDGRLDIVVTDQFTGDIRVLYNDPAAPFVRQTRFRAGTGLTSLVALGNTSEVHSLDAPMELVGGSFSGHAGEDLVVVNYGTNSIALLSNDGEGGFLNPQSLPAFATGNEPVAIVSGKFTAGPYLDLAVLNKGSADITIFLGDGHGDFTKGQTISAGNLPDGLAVGDLDGSGTLDLLVGNAQGDVLTLQGNGDGTFQAYQRIDKHVGLAVANTNDNQPEFVFADKSLDQVTFQYDDPGQSWQQGRQNGVLCPNQVKLADLNGDGIPDLIVANGGGNDILVYAGLANGQFGPAQKFYVGTDPVGITVADLTGDGILDVIVANNGSNDISILYGQGQGANWTLTSGPRLKAGTGPVATVVQDVNGDGIPDILVANSGSNDVYVLNGTGHGLFDDTHPAIYQTGSDPVQLFVGKFDTLPGLDLVTVNAGSNDLTFFPNFGQGQTKSLAGINPVAAVAGDFKHDGTSDLIVAGEDGRFALLSDGAKGLQINTDLTTSLVNVSDIALGTSTSGAVSIYATTEGTQAAFLVTFALDASPVLSAPASTAGLDLAQSQVSEFSAPMGNNLEIVVTVVFRSEYSPAFAEPSQAVLPGLLLGSREPEETEGLMIIDVYGGNDTGTLDRNSVITGASEAPVLRFLDRPLNAEELPMDIPFSSPLELFDARPQVPMDPSWQDVIEAIRGQMVGWSTLAYNPNLLDGALAPEPSVPVTPTPTDAPVAEETSAILERHHAGTDATPPLQSGSVHAAVIFLAAALVPMKSHTRQRRQEPVANTIKIRSSKGEPHAGSY